MDIYRRLFWILLISLTAFRIFLSSQFELAPDEAYYWTWSRHLDWSYFDQGPMLALVIGFFTKLFGSTQEWQVRMGSVILSFLSSWIFFELIIKLFKSTRAAWYGFLGFQSALLVSVGAVLMMHDSIMLFFWIACLYLFLNAIIHHWEPGWWLGALVLGLGALSKYTMALFVPCLLLFLILSPQQRIWWKKPHLYISGFITLLVVSPILFWNAGNDWASFGHVGDLGGVKKLWAFQLKTVGDYLGGQLAVLSPLLGFFCLASPVIGWKQWRKAFDLSEAFLFTTCFSAPIFIFFLLISVKTQVYANWPAPAYPAAIALLAGWISIHFKKNPLRLRKWILATLIFSFSLTALVYLEAAVGVLPLSGNAANSINRVRGWRPLGKQTALYLEQLRAKSPQGAFLAARRYQMGGILNFYTPGQPQVQLLPLREPANNQYRFWDRSELLKGQNALYVCEDYWEMEHIRKKFEHIESLPIFTASAKGKRIRENHFFFAYNFLPDKKSGAIPPKKETQHP